MLKTQTGSRLALIYLVALSVLMFALDQAWLLGLLLGLHLLGYLLLKLSAQPLQRVLKRMSLFLFFILLAYGINWSQLLQQEWQQLLNTDGLSTALVMGLRVLNLVVASLLVRLLSSADEFVSALRWLRVPATSAMVIDGVFALLSGPGMHAGMGRGNGNRRRRDPGGRRAGNNHHDKAGNRAARQSLSWQAIRQRRLQPMRDIIVNAMAQARNWLLQRTPGMASEKLDDLVVILGGSVAIMSLRLLQILPGLPIAPGHKNILIIPLYLFIAMITRSRFAATQCGIAIGVLSFFLGQGRFGIFELLQWILPGVAADLLAPLLRGLRGWIAVIAMIFAGVLLGVLRFSAGFALIMLAGGHIGLFAVYLPVLAAQVTFAAIGAALTPWLLQQWSPLKVKAEAVAGQLAAAEHEQTTKHNIEQENNHE